MPCPEFVPVIQGHVTGQMGHFACFSQRRYPHSVLYPAHTLRSIVLVTCPQTLCSSGRVQVELEAKQGALWLHISKYASSAPAAHHKRHMHTHVCKHTHTHAHTGTSQAYIRWILGPFKHLLVLLAPGRRSRQISKD